LSAPAPPQIEPAAMPITPVPWLLVSSWQPPQTPGTATFGGELLGHEEAVAA
jgi:hypothetical protein